jgi:hypothetical protein
MTPNRSKSKRLNALLLLGALVFAQVCAGFAAPPANATPMSATPASDRCCDTGSGSACAAVRDTIGAFDACARHCAQWKDAPQSHEGFPASAGLTFYGPAFSARAVFPSQHLRLRAAPRAASSTPLIYQFQRLLI